MPGELPRPEAGNRYLIKSAFKRIYVSGLLRTRQTSEYCCPGRAVTADVRLNEINLGTWENLSFDQVKKEAPEQFAQRGRDIYRFCTPGGESFQQLKNRVLLFWEEVVSMATKLSGPCLVVTHSGVIRILACVWSDIEFSRLLEFRPEYGQVLVVSRGPYAKINVISKEMYSNHSKTDAIRNIWCLGVFETAFI